MSEITITTQQMYDLLLKVDQTLTQAVTDLRATGTTVADHEARIRAIEAEEDLSRRLAVIEAHVAELQRKVWAIPSAATVIALAALIITFSRS